MKYAHRGPAKEQVPETLAGRHPAFHTCGDHRWWPGGYYYLPSFFAAAGNSGRHELSLVQRQSRRPRSYNRSMERPERRLVLAGESAVRVSAGAPGSRLRSQGEIRAARRSVKSPCNRGEQTHGPQQFVNAIASTNYQPKGVWESRAFHVTAKATDSILVRKECWILSGVAGGGTR
jgi:hypothetical protein